MRAYLLPLLTLLLLNSGSQLSAASQISAYDDKIPPYPLAFTLGVVAGATTAPAAILSLQMVGINPVTSYFSILAAASSSAYMLDIPYNTYRKEEAAKTATNWNLLQANYKNGTKVLLLHALSPEEDALRVKAHKEAFELLQLQSFAQGFLTGATLAPLMLYLKMPYVMIHP
jgi:hypothetical protein